MDDELVGSEEVAERLGYASRTIVHAWRRRYADFPVATVNRRSGMLWQWPLIHAWALAHGHDRRAG